MSVNEVFYTEMYTQQPEGRMPKNLRLNAREAAEYLTNLPYMDDSEAMRSVGRPGRGANGESAG